MKIQDYLHFYIGCQVTNNLETGKLVGVTDSEYERGKTIALIDFESDSLIEWYADDVKPILRKLSSMTEEEMKEVDFSLPQVHGHKLWGAELSFYPKQFAYLLSKGFDLFRLIDSNLAIDQESLKK